MSSYQDGIDLGWLAGILDGEACFRAPTSNRAQITLASTDLDTVERATRLMGLPIERIKTVDMSKEGPTSKKQLYKVYCCGDDARQVMRAVLPLMSKRRAAKIKEILYANAQT